MIKVVRKQNPQFCSFAISEVNTYVSDLIRSLSHCFTEALFYLFNDIEEMFASAQGVFPEIRTRAVGISSFSTPQCNTVALPGRMARNGIVGP